MKEAEAKKLKKDDRIVFNPNNDPTMDPRCEGTVVETTGRACGVMWDDGTMSIQYFATMAQIDRINARRAA